MMMNGQIIKYYSGKEPVPKLFYFQCTEEFDRKVRENMDRKQPEPEERPVFEADGVCGENIRDLKISVRAGECLVLQALDTRCFPGTAGIYDRSRKAGERTVLVDGLPASIPETGGSGDPGAAARHHDLFQFKLLRQPLHEPGPPL